VSRLITSRDPSFSCKGSSRSACIINTRPDVVRTTAYCKSFLTATPCLSVQFHGQSYHVTGQGPRGRGPDSQFGAVPFRRRAKAGAHLARFDIEGDIHRAGFVIVHVPQFSFCERGSGCGRIICWLEPVNDMASIDHRLEQAQLPDFKVAIYDQVLPCEPLTHCPVRGVRIVPVCHDSQIPHLRFLNLYRVQSRGTCDLSHSDWVRASVRYLSSVADGCSHSLLPRRGPFALLVDRGSPIRE